MAIGEGEIGMAWDYGVECTLVDGVLRWKTNGRVPPVNNVHEAKLQGLAVDEAACDAARTEETRVFLAAYRANPPQLTAENLAEARAAFGPGAKVVDVITGRRLVL